MNKQSQDLISGQYVEIIKHMICNKGIELVHNKAETKLLKQLLIAAEQNPKKQINYDVLKTSIGICAALLETGDSDDVRVVIKNLKEMYQDMEETL